MNSQSSINVNLIHNPHLAISVKKLTMLFTGFLNSRSNSFQLGGHDTNQVHKQMTKDTKDTSHLDRSSQHTRQDPTKPHNDLSRKKN